MTTEILALTGKSSLTISEKTHKFIISMMCQQARRDNLTTADPLGDSISYLDKVMTKFMINNRTEACKTDGRLQSNKLGLKSSPFVHQLVCMQYSSVRQQTLVLQSAC